MVIKPLLGWVDKCGRTLVAANITTLCPNTWWQRFTNFQPFEDLSATSWTLDTLFEDIARQLLPYQMRQMRSKESISKISKWQKEENERPKNAKRHRPWRWLK